MIDPTTARQPISAEDLCRLLMDQWSHCAYRDGYTRGGKAMSAFSASVRWGTINAGVGGRGVGRLMVDKKSRRRPCSTGRRRVVLLRRHDPTLDPTIGDPQSRRPSRTYPRAVIIRPAIQNHVLQRHFKRAEDPYFDQHIDSHDSSSNGFIVSLKR